MSLWDKVLGIATGGLADTAIKVAEKWFPPDMSEGEKQAVRLAFERLEMERSHATDMALQQASAELTDRIAKLEGTAGDLKGIPVIGTLVLFARGTQRPVWGFSTLWMDWQWFSSAWGTLSDQQQQALIIINFLVLGFLFGERAVKNLSPLIMQLLARKAG